MLRFSIFGFPVAVHWLFWVMIALFGGGLNANTPEQLQQLVMWMFAAFVSILIHELGHTFVMRHFGAQASIVLYSFGGLAIPNRGFSRGQNIIVSLAGPFVQIAVGMVIYYVLKSRLEVETLRAVHIMLMQDRLGLFDLLLYNFSYISVFWGILNLVPIYPLDGGQVVNSALGPRLVKISCVISIVFAIFLAILAGMYGAIFGAIFCGVMAYENIKRFRGEHVPSMLHPR